MTALKLYYRHSSYVPFQFTSKLDIEQVAADVRKQMGASGRQALTLRDLSAIEKMSVNGIDYDVWTDLDTVVHDADGNEVLGVFEYAPLSSTEAVSVLVSPANGSVSQQLVLSTLAHERGHAIFDGPALVAKHHNQPLFDLSTSKPVHAYRHVTETQEHLQRQPAMVPDHVRRAELRANEFMGSLLVPRDLLWDAVLEEAPKHALEVRYEDSLFAESMDGKKQIVWSQATYDLDCWSFTRAQLAPQFGVNPAFIQVRMMRYGIIPSNTKLH